MPENINVAADQPDLKEVVRRIDMASGLFAHAAASFSEIKTIFEAIASATETGTLANRLAQVGIGICENRDSDFTEYHEDYGAHADGYSAAMDGDPFRRLRTNIASAWDISAAEPHHSF